MPARPIDRSLPARQFVDTSHGRVVYFEAGDPAHAPLLLVHGLPTSSQLWRNVLDLLAPEYRCLAPDLRPESAG